MKDVNNLISAEDLLDIFSKVTLEYRKKAKQKARGGETNKLTAAELVAIVKKCSRLK